MQLPDRTGLVAASDESLRLSPDRPSWAWLDAIGRSLDFAAAIVDRQSKSMQAVGSGRAAAALSQELSDTDSSLFAAVWKTFGSDHSQQAAIGQLVAVCNRLVVQDGPVGVLVVAREAQDHSSPTHEQRHSDLEAIGSWLTRAVEAHLGRTSVDAGDEAFDRVSSLHRLLHDAAESGTEGELLTAFAEALFAWDGIETSGYVEDIHGEFSLAMTAPGGVRGRALVSLEAEAPARSATPTRLTAADLDRFGLPIDRHVVAIEIEGATPERWVILFSEGYRSLNTSRLVLYADLFREALVRLSTIAETRTTWGILQSLLGGDDSVETAIATSLRDLSRGLEAVAAALMVTSATGTTLLSVGEETVSGVRPFDRGNRLVSTAHLPDLGTMQLTLRRAPGQTFTRREQHLVDRVATIFSAWLPATLKRSPEPGQRPSDNRGFEQVLDRAAVQLLRDGLDVSALVISVPAASSRPLALQSWVTDIRAELRGTDLAGTLSDHEIGVVLAGTSRADVPVVCARLRRRLALDQGTVSAEIGVASRAVGSATEDSIVDAARRNIASRGSAL